MREGSREGRGEEGARQPTAKTGHDRHGYGSYVRCSMREWTEVWEIMGDETSGVCGGAVRDGYSGGELKELELELEAGRDDGHGEGEGRRGEERGGATPRARIMMMA